MQIKNTKDTYGVVSQFLHWAIAILILTAIVMGKVAHGMDMSPAKIAMYVFHKSVGITVLALVVVRIIWKFANPKTDAGLTPDQASKASYGHGLLYLLMFLMPLSGWILNSAANYPFGWMNLISVPMIPGISKTLQEPAETVHVAMFYILSTVVIGHILMVVYHKRFHQLDLISRMLPGNQKVSGAAVVLVAVLVLIPVALLATRGGSTVEAKSDSVELSDQSSGNTSVTSNSPLWMPDIENSSLAFKGSYSGEPFNGEFKNYRAKLYFDPQKPEQGVFDVVIDTTSVTTYTSDWDDTLSGSEWFAFKQFPEAFYSADTFELTDTGFIAKGNLTIKSISKPIDLVFSWNSVDESTVSFVAQSVVTRGDFEIGSGMWADDSSIGFDVAIDIELTLKTDG